MAENDQHLRDLQREYLDFLDDEVNTWNSVIESEVFQTWNFVLIF
jgi:hypothetical protein